jgi:hypothetical protein
MLHVLRCRPAADKGSQDHGTDKEARQKAAKHRGKQQKAMMAAMKRVQGVPKGKGKGKGGRCWHAGNACPTAGMQAMLAPLPDI